VLGIPAKHNCWLVPPNAVYRTRSRLETQGTFTGGYATLQLHMHREPGYDLGNPAHRATDALCWSYLLAQWLGPPGATQSSSSATCTSCVTGRPEFGSLFQLLR
jgi:hypothetical protein